MVEVRRQEGLQPEPVKCFCGVASREHSWKNPEARPFLWCVGGRSNKESGAKVAYRKRQSRRDAVIGPDAAEDAA